MSMIILTAMVDNDYCDDDPMMMIITMMVMINMMLMMINMMTMIINMMMMMAHRSPGTGLGPLPGRKLTRNPL